MTAQHHEGPPSGFFQQIAEDVARDAHEEHFESRRGLFVLTDDDGEPFALALYSNNPWRGESHEKWELREWLDDAGIKVLGESVYADYTTCWILDSPERHADIVNAWGEILRKLYASPDSVIDSVINFTAWKVERGLA